jgi:hypothetical protein
VLGQRQQQTFSLLLKFQFTLPPAWVMHGFQDCYSMVNEACQAQIQARLQSHDEAQAMHADDVAHLHKVGLGWSAFAV